MTTIQGKGWADHEGQWMPARNFKGTLPPGIYEPQPGDMFTPPCLKAVTSPIDRTIIVEDAASAHILSGIKTFWREKERYVKFGCIHKRGVLLEGPPGTGKTMTCRLVSEALKDLGGITVMCSDDTEGLNWALHSIRSVQPDVPILVIYEDIDQLATHSMYALLSLLDGEHQIAGIVSLATTNFLHRLDSRLTNRPSRFDEVIHVGLPSEKARHSYILQLLPEDERKDELVKALVEASDGLLISHLRELVLSTQVLGKPVAETCARLKGMEALVTTTPSPSVSYDALTTLTTLLQPTDRTTVRK